MLSASFCLAYALISLKTLKTGRGDTKSLIFTLLQSFSISQSKYLLFMFMIISLGSYIRIHIFFLHLHLSYQPTICLHLRLLPQRTLELFCTFSRHPNDANYVCSLPSPLPQFDVKSLSNFTHESLKCADSFNLLVNNGAAAGQVIYHV